MLKRSVLDRSANRLVYVVALSFALLCPVALFAGQQSRSHVASMATASMPVASIGASIKEGWSETKEQFEKGGAVMWWMLALSIVMLAMTIERGLRMRRSRIMPVGMIANARALWKQGKYDEIVAATDKNPSILGRALKTLVNNRDLGPDKLGDIVGTQMAIEMRFHFRRVTVLSAVAYLSPLLGLYGTVLGMMKAFQNFRLLGETGDPGVFAGEISLALVCTGAGLLVAIPSLALYHFFRQRTLAFEDELAETLHQLSVEWFKEKMK
jgi:biopolymer transport protein ExbB